MPAVTGTGSSRSAILYCACKKNQLAVCSKIRRKCHRALGRAARGLPYCIALVKRVS
jgi:hypothetical protein